MDLGTYLMTRVLGDLSEACSGLAAGFCSAVGCGAMADAVITSQTLSLTFLAMDKIAFWAMASAFALTPPQTP